MKTPRAEHDEPMSLLSFLLDDGEPGDSPQDVKWRRSPRGGWFRLMLVDPGNLDLDGQGGVFVVWHLGVRPEWVHVGAATDLARAIEAARDNPEITQYESRGRLYVTWSPIVEAYRDGVVRYLTDLLRPVVPSARDSSAAEPVPVLPPG